MGGTEINLKEKISSQNKRKRRRTGKKNATQSLQALYYIFLQEDRDIFISLCGQESSIIEQCLATKC